MDTPICDFVRQYAESDALRLHMPGHKGLSFLGMEGLDITEIDGADSLYEAQGIIRRSEENAGALFGCPTYYSTEGSSQCIRAMLYLTLLQAKQTGRKPLIAAARNVHKTFLSAAALLDLEVVWLYPRDEGSYLSCTPDPQELDRALRDMPSKPAAVYLTSPDYLGEVAPVDKIAQVCRRHGILLLVDHAHGAYMKFLPRSGFAIDLGADLCCSSAHKTLPVLTGGAYLHISPSAPKLFAEQAKSALALFGSTSPSYLILQSLDGANAYLSGFSERLERFLPKVEELKTRLTARGYCLYGKEPLKLTVRSKPYGYTGKELAQCLLEQGIVCEFADPDYLVLMLSPETGETGLARLEKALLSIPKRPPVLQTPPRFHPAQQVLSIREATLSLSRTVPVSQCEGQILAAATVGCPPAVPILICGERIDDHAIRCFHYYGFETCSIVRSPEKCI